MCHVSRTHVELADALLLLAPSGPYVCVNCLICVQLSAVQAKALHGKTCNRLHDCQRPQTAGGGASRATGAALHATEYANVSASTTTSSREPCRLGPRSPRRAARRAAGTLTETQRTQVKAESSHRSNTLQAPRVGKAQWGRRPVASRPPTVKEAHAARLENAARKTGTEQTCKACMALKVTRHHAHTLSPGKQPNATFDSHKTARVGNTRPHEYTCTCLRKGDAING